jgi:predicted RNA-binding protein
VCEFDVILDGESVFEDVVYVKIDDNNVIVRDVLGGSRKFNKCRIVEVDVNTTRLTLSSI